jgi:hypothetical protein
MHAFDSGESGVRCRRDREAGAVQQLAGRSVHGDHGLERLSEARAHRDLVERQAVRDRRHEQCAEGATPCEVAQAIAEKS